MLKGSISIVDGIAVAETQKLMHSTSATKFLNSNILLDQIVSPVM